MIILPIERIFKPGDTSATQTSDDRDLDPALASALSTVLGDDRLFGDAPFAKIVEWRYVRNYPAFNVALGWPSELLDELAAPKAIENARNAPAKRILLDLRNALAHGGVVYLDENGRNAYGQAAGFAFVALARGNDRLKGLNILRVTETGFEAFLGAWSDWLSQQTVVLRALDEHSLMAA